MPSSPLTAAHCYALADRIVASYKGRVVVSIEPVLDGRKYYRLRFDLGDTVLVTFDYVLEREALLADLYDTNNVICMQGTALRYKNGSIFVNDAHVKACVTAANGFIELQLEGGTCVRITDMTYHELITW